MGLPGLCGFVGEFFVMMSAWKFSPTLARLAILSTIPTAIYLLRAWQRVYMGTNPNTAKLPDVTAREFVVLLPLVLMAIVLGVLPFLLNRWIQPSVHGWIAVMGQS